MHVSHHEKFLDSTKQRENVLEKKMFSVKKNEKQVSIPVQCVPQACQPYVFRWPPLDVDRMTDRSL